MIQQDYISFAGHAIDGITVDFWHTIVQDTTWEERAHTRTKRVHEWLASHGRTTNLKDVEKTLQEFYSYWRAQWLENRYTPGPIDCAAQILRLQRGSPPSPELLELANLIEDTILDHPPELLDGAHEALQELRNVVPLALVCDTGLTGPRSIDALLKNWKLFELFEARIYSIDVGVSKPNPAMFLSALEALGVSTKRALHIGDLEATDVKGAKNLGMAAIRFDGAKNPTFRESKSGADLIVNSWTEVTDALLKSLNAA